MSERADEQTGQTGQVPGDGVVGGGARQPGLLGVVRRWAARTLWEQYPRDHRESPAALRRRQVVTIGFVVIGAVVLSLSLRLTPGSAWFYPATFGLAGVWTIGAFASGPLHLGRIEVRDVAMRPVLQPIVIGAVLAGIFVVGGLVVRQIPPLAHEVRGVLGFATEGSIPVLVVITAVNGIAEELFFRGAAYAAITRHPVAWTTVLYTIATLATGNVMLAFAAILLGFLVGLERRASGGILGPILTHCTWSLAMLFALPAIFNV